MAELGGGLIPAGNYGSTINNPLRDGSGRIHSHNQQLNKDLAPVVGKDLKTPPDWGVVVIGFGEEASERGLVTITYGDWVLRFTRNVRCAIPKGHLQNLMQTVETRYMQPHEGAQMVSYKASRYQFQVLKWPESMMNRESVESFAKEVDVA